MLIYACIYLYICSICLWLGVYVMSEDATKTFPIIRNVKVTAHDRFRLLSNILGYNYADTLDFLTESVFLCKKFIRFTLDNLDQIDGQIRNEFLDNLSIKEQVVLDKIESALDTN